MEELIKELKGLNATAPKGSWTSADEESERQAVAEDEARLQASERRIAQQARQQERWAELERYNN